MRLRTGRMGFKKKERNLNWIKLLGLHNCMMTLSLTMTFWRGRHGTAASSMHGFVKMIGVYHFEEKVGEEEIYIKFNDKRQRRNG